MRALTVGLLSVAGLALTFVNPPAGVMVLAITSSWFLWRYG